MKKHKTLRIREAPCCALSRAPKMLEPLGATGPFVSPQGIRIRVESRYALLADDALGLLRLGIGTNEPAEARNKLI